MNNYTKYFGSPVNVAATLAENGLDSVFDICAEDTCSFYNVECLTPGSVCPLDTYDGILKWLIQEVDA